MSEFAIYADSKARGTCRSCGARITWTETTQGRKIPIEGWDFAPVRTQSDILGGARTIEFLDTAVSPTHFERCPDADTWRRR